MNFSKTKHIKLQITCTSLHSKSSLNAHNFKRAESSEIDDKVSKNCSALPRGNSGLIICASWILPRSSSVGNIFNSLSMPSRVTTVASIFNMAALIARGGGSFVIAIFIAFDRLWSSTIISLFLFISCCFCNSNNNFK